MIGFLDAARNILWNRLFVPLFLIVGLRCIFELRHIKLSRIKIAAAGEDGIKPYQTLFANLASTLGTGNIAGVSLAIYSGGAGSVFWMWAAAVVGMCISFCENTLGVKMRNKNSYPVPYMKKPLAKAFSLCCILASFGMGNMTQANSAAEAARNAFSIPPIFAGAVMALFAALIILRGLNGILRFTDRFVPLMGAFYILFSLGIIIINKDMISEVVREIFSEAFTAKAILGGSAAIGIARGVFSGEAGLGSSVILSSLSNAKTPETQGFIGMLSIFLDTIVMCSLTAFAILTSKSVSAAGAFYWTFGSLGGKLLDISVIFFAFTTIIGWSYYGDVCSAFLFGEKGRKIYKILCIAFIMAGSMAKMESVWALSDIFNALMALPNLLSLVIALKFMHKPRGVAPHTP